MNLPTGIPLYFVAVQQIAEEGQTDKIPSDIEVCMNQRCVTEFLHTGKIVPTDVHGCLLSGCECSEAVDVVSALMTVA